MIPAVKQYFLSLTAACLLLSVVTALLPQGAVRRLLLFTGGLLLLLTAVKPLVRLDLSELLRQAEFSLVDTGAVPSMSEVNSDLMRDIISQRCSTYILDKAAKDGIALKAAEVTVSDDGTAALPQSVVIRGQFTQRQRDALSSWIEDALGIAAEDQSWNWE